MAAEKTAPIADPFAWDPDPVVLVSRRNRVLTFPAALLRGEMSDDAVRRYMDPPKDSGAVGTREEKMLAVLAGVNFLGARTTAWSHLRTQQSHAPTGAPDPNAMITVWPYCTGHDIVAAKGGPNYDRETGKVRPDGIRMTLLRVLEFHKRHRPADSADLWATADGFDAPELSLLRLSEVFRQHTPAGRDAHVSVTAAIPHLRRTAEVLPHLGALHDYAIRDRAGSGIMMACRQWAQRKKVG